MNSSLFRKSLTKIIVNCTILFQMLSQAKQKRIRAEIKAVWAEVNRLKEIADMKREVRAARDAKNA